MRALKVFLFFFFHPVDQIQIGTSSIEPLIGDAFSDCFCGKRSFQKKGPDPDVMGRKKITRSISKDT